MTFYGMFWLAGGNDIIAIKFHLSLNDVTYFMRVAVFVGPVIAFIVTKRICLSLQRADRDRVLHGSESGVIVRSPDGGYTEAHLPISEGEAYTLTRHPQLEELTPSIEVGRKRKRLSRWYADGQVPVPTAEEIEAADTTTRAGAGVRRQGRGPGRPTEPAGGGGAVRRRATRALGRGGAVRPLRWRRLRWRRQSCSPPSTTSRSTASDIVAVTAREVGELVGFGYGHRWLWAEQNDDWSAELAQQLGEDAHRLDQAFAVQLLAVHPRFTHRGLGFELLKQLMVASAAPVHWLQLEDSDTPARRLFRRMGYRPLGDDAQVLVHG